MNPAIDPVQDRIESAERMLREARVDVRNGRREDAQEFLRAAGRHIAKAVEASEAASAIINMRERLDLPTAPTALEATAGANANAC